MAGARAVGYVNAGTMEFIVKGAEFYFLEMNTRLQVEHPVTEEVTGLDLVQAQLRVAVGRAPAVAPGRDRPARRRHRVPDLRRGSRQELHAVARDHLARLTVPEGPGVRLEFGVAEGVQVSVHYDPLLAKLITRGATREEAIARMQAALDGFVVEGVRTVIPFHRRVLESAAFRAGRVHTQMVEQGAFNA